MLNFIRPRLRVPLITAIAGTMLAVAWIIRGGHDWWLAVAIEVVAVARFLMLYIWGGEDSDDGAVIGSRGDERQREIAQRCWAITGKVAMAGVAIGLAVTVAARTDIVWAFVGLVPLLVITLGLTLSRYSAGVPDGSEEPARGRTQWSTSR